MTLSLFAAAAFADVQECPPRYSYCGYSGPEQWKNIVFKDKRNECNGTTQSPINLGTPTPTSGPTIHVEYVGNVAGNATIRNTGHDIEVTPMRGNNKIKVGSRVYTLLQLHFHVPNEHHVPRIDKAVAEMHILHQLDGGTDYAVIGVMLTIGTPTDSALAPVFENLPKEACAPPKPLEINFKKLLPEELTGYYTYVGSLTTPPCTEKEKTVTWYVLDAPREIPASDLIKLGALGKNARPIQTNPLTVTYVSPTPTPK